MAKWDHDLKLQRARKHLKELKAEIDRWKADGYTISVEPKPDPKHREYEVKAFIVRHLERDPFSLLVGDFLQNARAALDYVAFALGNAGAEGGWMSPDVALNSGFPIVSDVDSNGLSGRGPDNFADAATRKLPTVAEPARAAIEQSQPYYTGGHGAWQWEPLWVLNELARFDRHRFLALAAVRTGEVKPDPARWRNVGIRNLEYSYGTQVIEDPPWDDDNAETGGAIIARVEAEIIDPRKQVQMEFLTELEVGFDFDSLPPTIEELTAETPVSLTCTQIDHAVGGVLRLLAPFLPAHPPH